MSAIERLPQNNSTGKVNVPATVLNNVKQPERGNVVVDLIDQEERQHQDEVGKAIRTPQGADKIIDHLTGATRSIEAYTVDAIDELINQLTTLKELVKLKSSTSIGETKNFVGLISQTLKDIDQLKSRAKDIEQHVDQM